MTRTKTTVPTLLLSLFAACSADTPIAAPRTAGAGAPAGPADPGTPGAAGTPADPGAPAAPGEPIDPAAARRMAEETESAIRAAAVAPRFTATYEHPAGVYFMHPGDWTVQPVREGIVSLSPGDLHQVEGEPAELFLVLGEDAAGITRPDDPQVVQLVTDLVTSSFPYLQRAGAPRARTIDGQPCVELRWNGKTRGLEVAAAMQVKLVAGLAIGAFTLTSQDRFERRRRTVTDVFRTIAYERPAVDPRLVGPWRHSETYISGSFSTITVRNLVLCADGTFQEGGKLMAGMGHHDSTGEFTGSTNASHASGVEHRGRWRMAGKSLTLTWAGGGSETWRFYIEGGSMVWKSGKARKLWRRAR